MHHRLTAIVITMAGLLATSAGATPPPLTLMPPSTPNPAMALPARDATPYSADTAVNCAIAVAALGMSNARDVDPMLHGAAGDIDCHDAFHAAGLTTRDFASASEPRDHLFVTRPVQGPNGKPYVAVVLMDGRFRQGRGFYVEQQNGQWLADEPVGLWIT